MSVALIYKLTKRGKNLYKLLKVLQQTINPFIKMSSWFLFDITLMMMHIFFYRIRTYIFTVVLLPIRIVLLFTLIILSWYIIIFLSYCFIKASVFIHFLMAKYANFTLQVRKNYEIMFRIVASIGLMGKTDSQKPFTGWTGTLQVHQHF